MHGYTPSSGGFEEERMTTPVNLPTKQWKTKKDARTYFQEMLNSYKDGQNLSQDDANLVIELVQTYYHTPVDKLGTSGITRVFRDMSPEEVDPTRSTSCFWIERTDGTSVNFGADKCLNKIPKP